MVSNDRRQAEWTGKYGTLRQEHLQDLVAKFQTAKSEEKKEKITSNLANFAYDPYYAFLSQLNVLELFIGCLTEPNERLVEIRCRRDLRSLGSSNSVPAGSEIARIVAYCGGVPALIECLSSPARNTVKYAIAGLYHLLERGCCDRREILKAEVVEWTWKYAEAGGGGIGFGNLARVLLDKHCADSTAYLF